MRRESVEVFHALMKRGWIDRREDSRIWGYSEEIEIQEDLESFKEVLGFDLYRVRDRLYLIPTQGNDLFLKNNADYRRDIRADNTVRMRDLYLMNYLSIYLIYLFFNGEGSDPLSREFISKEDLILQFSNHCESVMAKAPEGDEKEYSENFRGLAEDWLGKTEGEESSQKFDQRYGILNRILAKYKNDGIFSTDEGLIRPTRKMRDLIPYFLRKDRIAEIQSWIEEKEHAKNQ